MNKRDNISNIISNAQRLYDDSEVLRAQRRFSSCALLQFFALEETGKALYCRMQIRLPQKNLHVAKQQAGLASAASFRAAKFLHRKLEELGIKKEIPVGFMRLTDFDLIDQFADGKLNTWLQSGGYKEYQKHTRTIDEYFFVSQTGIFEYFRRVSAYFDENPRIPEFLEAPLVFSSFGESWALEMSQIISDAISGIDDSYAHAIMKAVYLRHIDR